ncbi:hypothetical protein GOP47_0009625 [Adiantum capillus-veneris]|uniref:WRKY19-like zinc finger domain-containing protein n=1 Tax=Adiantum capillus-veneris TaxID=13818 RepID=A0A9D4ZHD9_ADICA|nr:hypothetical protein GOP47_0009625 [Adiantum capillus-veneris]
MHFAKRISLERGIQHESGSQDSVGQKPHIGIGRSSNSPSEGFQAMDFRADSLKGMKRMRLNNGEVVDSVCMWESPSNGSEDDCRLELGVGSADCKVSIVGSSDEIGLGRPHRIAQASSPLSSNLSRSLCPPGHINDADNLSLTMGLFNTEFNMKSWNSTGSFCSEDPYLNVSQGVKLGLGLTVMPSTSGADSVLTSILPSSNNCVDASEDLLSHKVTDVLKPDRSTSLPSFCQEGSLLCAYNADVPMIDEGSTSNGGYILPFLKAYQVSKAPCLDAWANFTSVQESAADSDISMSFRALSGTTSTSGTSSGSGFGDRAPKMCRFTGCVKRARGASGLCISHGGGRRCQRLGCNKGAEGSTIFCKAHGGGRRCEHLGCTKSAEGKTDFCIAHGGGSRCLFEGCPKAARGRTGYCIKHGGGKRCQKAGCTKSAEGYSALCIAHGGGKRCQYPDCGKGAQGSTMFCKGHGGGKRCTVEGCNKGAEGSTPLCKGHGGGKRCMFEGGGICSKSVHGGTLYCVAHGGGKRCAVEGCTKSARGRTDCCVKHGGGKRCKFENCDKSAQGSTDFCKAHGGGKRCLWGQESFLSSFKDIADAADFFKGFCDKTAKGKLGLCTEHSALVQDRRVHGVGTFTGTPFPRNEAGGNLLSGLIARGSVVQVKEGLRNCELESSLQFSEGNEGLPTEVARMQESASPISESQLFPQRYGLHCSKSYSTYVSANFGGHMPLSKPVSETKHLVSAPFFGVSSVHRPTLRKDDAYGQGGSSNMEDDEVFDMSSLSLPEERVHGGNIMALLSGGRLKCFVELIDGYFVPGFVDLGSCSRMCLWHVTSMELLECVFDSVVVSCMVVVSFDLFRVNSKLILVGDDAGPAALHSIYQCLKET